MKEMIILIGGGGHCKSVIDVIESGKRFSIVGIIDKKERVGEKVFTYDIIGSDEDLEKLFEKCPNAVVTIGQIHSNEARVQLYDKLCEIGYQLPVIISPHAYVSKHAEVGNGTVIMHHALVNADAVVGRNCIVNTKALIEHDAIVGDHCHISTGAVVNGGVKVDENTFVGSNATTKEYCAVQGFIKAGGIAK